MGIYWLIIIGVIAIAVFIVYRIYLDYRKPKPTISRKVRIVEKRLSQGLLRSYLHQNIIYTLIFVDTETGQRIYQTLPPEDISLYDRVLVGDEGVLLTKGWQFIGFTSIRRNVN